MTFTRRSDLDRRIRTIGGITAGAVDVIATGNNSSIDFSSLATFSPTYLNGTRRFRAENGGVIISPNLTTIGGQVSVELSGTTSVLDLADLSVANGLSFRAENGATLTLPIAITSYAAQSNGSEIRALSGGTIDLHAWTSYTSSGSVINSTILDGIPKGSHDLRLKRANAKALLPAWLSELSKGVSFYFMRFNLPLVL